MAYKENLIELLDGFQCECACEEEGAECPKRCNVCIADHLLSNGVTVQAWVSVEDELPKRSEYNFNEYIVKVVRSHWPTSSYDVIDAPYDEEYTTFACYDHDQMVWHLYRSEEVLNALLKPEDAPVNGDCVTHWMPMPK